MTERIKLSMFMGTDLRVGAGTEHVALELSKRKPQDFDLTIFQTKGFDKLRLSKQSVDEMTRGCHVVTIDTDFLPSTSLWRMTLNQFVTKPTLRAYQRLDGEVKKIIRQTDVAYLFFNYYAPFLRDKAGIPVVGSEHTGIPPLPPLDLCAGCPQENSLKRYARNLYRYLEYRIYYSYINGFHSFPASAKLLERLNLKYKMVLPNGVDTLHFFPDYDLSNDKLKLLFVARLTRVKGTDVILSLADRLADDKRVEFHVAGGGPMEREVAKNNNIVYHGALNDEDLTKLYRQCDLFVYPTRGDTFGLVVLEALSSGLYVIASDALRGTFDDFEGKYLKYVPADVDSFYGEIKKVLENRALMRHDKLQEFSYVKSNYDWDAIAGKFYAYMRQFYKQSRQSA
ncbi:glycosyltransferase family 4 protein [Tardisphaera miroshnichenkoae]